MARTLIVGDVHGCIEELDRLLDAVHFDSSDRLVFVGDLVARGPDSAAVVRRARELGAQATLGNHEARLIDFRNGATTKPLSVTHRTVADELDAADWEYLEAMPFWIDLEPHDVRVVHAAIDARSPIESQSRATFILARTLNDAGHPTPSAKGRLWGETYEGTPHVVFGHHAIARLQLHPWATGLDTGCVYGGELTALVLGEGERVPRDLDARRKHLCHVAPTRAYYPPV